MIVDFRMGDWLLRSRSVRSTIKIRQSTIVNRTLTAARIPKKTVKSPRFVVSCSTSMKTPSRRHPAAFTLIELMAVVTIIVILAGIVVAGLGFVNEKQAREKAKVQIGMLERAIEEYKMDMGAYPGTGANFGGTATASGGDSSQVLYNTLFKDGYDYTNPNSPPSNWAKATKIYIAELDPRNSKLGWVDPVTNATPPTGIKLRDPWGNTYRYRVGNNAQNPDFDLWSMGKNGTTDPVNKIKDDIRNF
jgi:prepilin-type N-terminal cleavage/methylation domain-containing protein